MEWLKNGSALVLGYKPTQGGHGRIVLCVLPDGKVTNFATWVQHSEPNAEGLFWGHYFSDITSAVEDFNQRGRRG